MNSIPNYKDVRLEGDGDTFTLHYTPTDTPRGRPQVLLLDADNVADAVFEAASNLECEIADIPPVEWQ